MGTVFTKRIIVKIGIVLFSLGLALMGQASVKASCLECHDEMKDSRGHTELPCQSCHLHFDSYPHDGNGRREACGTCHLRHDESVAHDAHIGISCEACHLEAVVPIKDIGGIRWRLEHADSEASAHQLTDMTAPAACRRCHFPENSFGAAAMVLPTKSLLCMPCHPATFSVNDTVSVVALLIFTVGMLGLGVVWFSGAVQAGKNRRTASKTACIIDGPGCLLFIRRIRNIAKAFVLDVLFQRRLFRQSGIRWAIHGMIFYAIVLRFLWGLVALLFSLWAFGQPSGLTLLNKNHPVTALFFDVTGLMMVLGVVFILIQKRIKIDENELSGLHGPNWTPSLLLLGVIVVGFILEGIRIAMTGYPPGAVYSFVGYGLGKLYQGLNLIGVYGYIWYAHALLIGIFAAYLPFSRMRHMIIVPIGMAMNAASQIKSKPKETDNGDSGIPYAG